jgi:4-hydroxybenzoate polyprenyltransferase
MRPKQWIKNTFVLAPLIFSGTFTEWVSIQQAMTAFVLFCFASSATYVLNDYRDIESDRKHPIKSQKRPLASGEVTKPQAKILMALLYSSVIGAYWFHPQVVAVITAYLLLNVAYTFYLKHQPVLDIFTIAAGFVLRVYAGAVALDIPLSSWMFITTLSLALYLASIKRKQELIKNGKEARSVLQHYTISLVDKYAEMSATCAILFYSLFVISDAPEMVYTIPFVLFGLYRYWYVVESKEGGESPTDALFSDIQLQVTIAGWIVACGYSILQ